ncbi:MAG: alpha/beta hydrolase [Pseudomonadota bacterium]
MLVDTPANPLPKGAISTEITTPDGVTLRTARWPLEGTQRLGTVCLFQGRGEYIEKYFETVGELRARGFAVATLDWRGQGGSERLLKNPLKGHVDSFADYVTDLKTFMEQIVLPECPPPYYVLAHSMGGLVLFLAEPLLRNSFERMVFTSPLFGLGPMYHPVGAARAATKILASLGLRKSFPPGESKVMTDFLPFAGNPVTSDAVRFARNADVLRNAPQLALGSPTIGWANAAFKAMEQVSDATYSPRIAVPIMMIAAGADKVVSNIAIEHVVVGLRAGSRIVLPGAQHEILQERSVFREQFYAAFDAFIPGSPVY